MDRVALLDDAGRWSSLFNRNISETVSRTGVVARRSLADYEKKKVSGRALRCGTFAGHCPACAPTMRRCVVQAVKKSNDKDLHQTLTADFMGRDCFLLEFDLK